MEELGFMLAEVKGRKFIYKFCKEYLQEDIKEIIDTRGKPYPELTRVALNVKQELADNFPKEYEQLKLEAERNEW